MRLLSKEAFSLCGVGCGVGRRAKVFSMTDVWPLLGHGLYGVADLKPGSGNGAAN